MSSVTFSSTVGGNNSTVTDDDNATTGLANGGHRTRFVPALAQVVAVASYTVSSTQTAQSQSAASAAAAAASAASAIASPATSATSTTSLAIGTGSKSLTIQTGKSVAVGMSVKVAYTTTPTNWMHGDVTAYDSGTGALTVNVTTTQGSGTYTAWTVSLSSPIQALADNGVPLSKLPTMAQNSFLSRKTSGTGNVEALTQAESRAALGLATTDTPTFAGIAANSLATIKSATFNGETVISTTTGSITVDWSANAVYKQNEPTGTISYTFTAPAAPCHLQLYIDSDGTSTAQAFNWPGTVVWIGFQWAATANKRALINFWWNGSKYLAMGANEA